MASSISWTVIPILYFSIVVIGAYLVPSCQIPPCKYNVYREGPDTGNVITKDASSHVISWVWEVKGGRWNVSYHYIYPDGWYEGIAQFINCSGFMDSKEPASVSWGSSKPWESNAVPVYGNAWNISYNGDTFGFIPTGNGKYVFRVFSRNKQHNPFGNEQIIDIPGSCSFKSSDKAQIKAFWLDRKKMRNCEVSSFNWFWIGNNGKWHVDYKWNQQTNKIICNVYYGSFERPESLIITWEINAGQQSVTYRSNPVQIYNEPAWSIDLGQDEIWGFVPLPQGKWTFQHYSRRIVFQPFMN